MNGMTHEVKQLREIPGLMACVLTHKVTESTAQYKWTGPKLNDEWPAILSFFDWTYRTMRSESQVRLFVNERTKVWKAWAFPQKARTNMTAWEIGPGDGEEHYAKTKEQRAMFSDTEGWNYYGTVHHHCGCMAFQSGPDEANERGQDGIHITVGSMDKPIHDIHFRIYQNGLKLTNVKPIEFWDIGAVSQIIPDKVRMLLAPDWLDKMVAIQMGTPAPGVAFPDIWKSNVIDITPKAVATASGGVSWQGSQHGYQGGNQNYHNMKKVFSERSQIALEGDLKKARWECTGFLRSPHTKMVKLQQVIDLLEVHTLQMQDDDYNLLDICFRNDITPDQLIEYIIEMEKRDAAAIEERLKKMASGEVEVLPEGGKKSKKAQQAQQLGAAAQEEIDRSLHWSHPDFVGYPSQQQLHNGIHGGDEGIGSGA